MVKRHYLKIFYIKSFFSFGSTRSHPLSPLLPHKTIWQPPDVICNNVPWLLLPTSSSSSRSVNGGEKREKVIVWSDCSESSSFQSTHFSLWNHTLSLSSEWKTFPAALHTIFLCCTGMFDFSPFAVAAPWWICVLSIYEKLLLINRLSSGEHSTKLNKVSVQSEG